MARVKVSDFLIDETAIDLIYPVGITIFFAQNKDPNVLFPGTKWAYVSENRLVRLANKNGSNLMQLGGSDNVTLTVNNVPAHGHSFSGTTSGFDYGRKWTAGAGGHNHTTAYSVNNWKEWSGGGQGYFGAGKDAVSWAGDHTHYVDIGSHSHTFNGTTANNGSGQSFSVTNPYVMLMAWHRTE